jgi:hypothetical protein
MEPDSAKGPHMSWDVNFTNTIILQGTVLGFGHDRHVVSENGVFIVLRVETNDEPFVVRVVANDSRLVSSIRNRPQFVGERVRVAGNLRGATGGNGADYENFKRGIVVVAEHIEHDR